VLYFLQRHSWRIPYRAGNNCIPWPTLSSSKNATLEVRERESPSITPKNTIVIMASFRNLPIDSDDRWDPSTLVHTREITGFESRFLRSLRMAGPIRYETRPKAMGIRQLRIGAKNVPLERSGNTGTLIRYFSDRSTQTWRQCRHPLLERYWSRARCAGRRKRILSVHLPAGVSRIRCYPLKAARWRAVASALRVAPRRRNWSGSTNGDGKP